MRGTGRRGALGAAWCGLVLATVGCERADHLPEAPPQEPPAVDPAGPLQDVTHLWDGGIDRELAVQAWAPCWEMLEAAVGERGEAPPVEQVVVSRPGADRLGIASHAAVPIGRERYRFRCTVQEAEGRWLVTDTEVLGPE